ncbi:MAG: endonuclease V [Spirochaetia bacterium]|nr:endonuclease V [Spirochaetota bacterium]MCX8096860.1 endonuclease V [Spirochaetota bacterium]MDW8111794.1 endonuclease V [Spirochaetia bacterium]
MNFEILNLTFSARSIDECKRVQLIIKDLVEERELDLSKVRTIGGVDVSYCGDYGIGVLVVADATNNFNIIEQVVSRSRISFPYIPGFLAFREIPVIIDTLNLVKDLPDIIIVDGQGIAHPRRAGIATHLGTIIQKPTIGCAKSLLYGQYVDIPNIKGYEGNIIDPLTKEIIGKVIRTKVSSRPVFVSVGNYISLRQSVDIVKNLSDIGNNRLPLVTFLADKISKSERKKL